MAKCGVRTFRCLCRCDRVRGAAPGKLLPVWQSVGCGLFVGFVGVTKCPSRHFGGVAKVAKCPSRRFGDFVSVAKCLIRCFGGFVKVAKCLIRCFGGFVSVTK